MPSQMPNWGAEKDAISKVGLTSQSSKSRVGSRRVARAGMPKNNLQSLSFTEPKRRLPFVKLGYLDRTGQSLQSQNVELSPNHHL